ncbi:MAG: DUF2147 domain-containing protein [Bryobacteraceae bacterium]
MRQTNGKLIQHLGVVAAVFAAAVSLCAADLSPEGLWKTTDDKTGKPKGLVRIYQENGAFFGRVEVSLDPAKAKEVCDLCKDERRNQPVVGMVVMRNMRKNGDEYNGGDILDPDIGTVYRCKFRVEDQGRKLIVRGFIGFSLFGRSQTWVRQP